MEKILIVTVACVILAMAVSPVLAFGPEQAADVGNNPNVDTDFDVPTTGIETPSEVLHTWDSETGKIGIWINAKPSGEGKINNVDYVIDSLPSLMYWAQNMDEFEGLWIYWSGEETAGTFTSLRYPTEGAHGAIYWLERGSGNTAQVALEIALSRPYGAYSYYHIVGNE